MYKIITEDQLDRMLTDYFDGKSVLLERGGQTIVETITSDIKFRKEVKACLKSLCTLRPPEGVYEPFYIGSKKQVDLTRAIVFRNGIYHVLENRLEPLTPDIFITSTLPYDYNPNTKCDLWLWFVEDIFNGNEEAIALLQEWLGYNLIASNHMEQMMFFFGVPGSGKSTTIDVLQALLGPKRYYAMDIEQFTSRFGLESLIGKYGLIVSDDSETDRKKLNKILNRFKRITGQDVMNINRRYKKSINIKPTWRITYVGNDLPEFNDEPQAMLRRLNLLYFENDYYKKDGGPDRTLKNRLIKEAQGIAMWTIRGLRRLLKNGCFTRPRNSINHLQEFNLLVNPLRAMVDECCKIYIEPSERTKHEVSREHLFQLHKVWYEENNLKSLGKASFGMKFHNLGLPIQKKQVMEQGKRIWKYEGIKILQGAFQKYLGGLK